MGHLNLFSIARVKGPGYTWYMFHHFKQLRQLLLLPTCFPAHKAHPEIMGPIIKEGNNFIPNNGSVCVCVCVCVCVGEQNRVASPESVSTAFNSVPATTAADDILLFLLFHFLRET